MINCEHSLVVLIYNLNGCVLAFCFSHYYEREWSKYDNWGRGGTVRQTDSTVGCQCSAIVSFGWINSSQIENVAWFLRCILYVYGCRLRNTRVLVIGMKGVAGEVCKNLILSGVKSVTMMDDEKACKSDLQSQYLLHPDSVGENVSGTFTIRVPTRKLYLSPLLRDRLQSGMFVAASQG